MIIELHPTDPQKRFLDMIAQNLQKGAIYILPTDTVFAFVALVNQKKAIENLYRLKEIAPTKPLSLYCKDFSQISEYARVDNNQTFRWMKNHLPGPFTLVFEASKKMPDYALTKKKTIGIRYIDHLVIEGLLDRLELPLIGSSVFLEGEYLTYAEDLEEIYGSRIEAVVNCGPIEMALSTVLDATVFPPEIIRQGKGIV